MADQHQPSPTSTMVQQVERVERPDLDIPFLYVQRATQFFWGPSLSYVPLCQITGSNLPVHFSFYIEFLFEKKFCFMSSKQKLMLQHAKKSLLQCFRYILSHINTRKNYHVVTSTNPNFANWIGLHELLGASGPGSSAEGEKGGRERERKGRRRRRSGAQSNHAGAT